MKSLFLTALLSLASARLATASTAKELLDEGRREAMAQHNDRAAELFIAVLSANPTNHDVAMALGTVYVQMKDFPKAYAALQPLLPEYASNYILLNNLAWIHATASEPELFKPDEAVRLARAALLLAPSDYHVWSTLSEALYAQGQFDEATSVAEQTFRLAEQDPRAGDALPAYRVQIEKCKQAQRALSLVE